MTVALVVITSAVGVAQMLAPELLDHLERTPQLVHGDWWRIATALFVQDGGLVGAVSNLVFLAIIGTLAEQVLPRGAWLLHYFGVGIVTELIALAWQPVGGGNSIAVCGLTGAVAVAWGRADDRLPRVTAPVLVLWCGALLGTIPALTLPAIVLASIGAGSVVRHQAEHPPARGPVIGAIAATTVVLIGATNIHGAALLLSLLLALVTVGHDHVPARPTSVARRPDAPGVDGPDG